MPSSRDATDTIRLVSPSEVGDRLARAGDREVFSSLVGDPCLVVDLRDEAVLAESPPGHWGAGLRELACPSIAWIPRAGGVVPARWAGDFDVVVSDGHELEVAVNACARNPLAALALMQLLRRGDSIHGGLESESLVYSMLQAGPEFAAWLSAHRARGTRVARSVDRPPLRVERCGDNIDLVLDRPEKRNAFSAELRDGLVEAFGVVLADRSVARVRLRAEGSAFCSGGDLDEFGTFPDPATAHVVRSTRNLARRVAACAERLSVELHGACVGAGIEIPAFAARVVARRDAYFQLPEVAMGLVPGAGGTVSLPRRIGRQRTAWMALSGAKVDAETALDWCLVDELSD